MRSVGGLDQAVATGKSAVRGHSCGIFPNKDRLNRGNSTYLLLAAATKPGAGQATAVGPVVFVAGPQQWDRYNLFQRFFCSVITQAGRVILSAAMSHSLGLEPVLAEPAADPWKSRLRGFSTKDPTWHNKAELWPVQYCTFAHPAPT